MLLQPTDALRLPVDKDKENLANAIVILSASMRAASKPCMFAAGDQSTAAAGAKNKENPANHFVILSASKRAASKPCVFAAGDQSTAAAGAKDKENPANAAAKAPALEGIIKPVPGRSRFNTAMEANPLAALNPRHASAPSHFKPLRPARMK